MFERISMKDNVFSFMCNTLVELCEKTEIILNDCLEKELQADKAALMEANPNLTNLICQLSVLKFASSLLVYYPNRGTSLLLKHLQFMNDTTDKLNEYLTNSKVSELLTEDALKLMKNNASRIKSVISDIVSGVKDKKPKR